MAPCVLRPTSGSSDRPAMILKSWVQSCPTNTAAPRAAFGNHITLQTQGLHTPERSCLGWVTSCGPPESQPPFSRGVWCRAAAWHAGNCGTSECMGGWVAPFIRRGAEATGNISAFGKSWEEEQKGPLVPLPPSPPVSLAHLPPGWLGAALWLQLDSKPLPSL